ncbi:MAG TPA: hypothetical protein VF613_13095 [Longimicrobium sp.]
MTFPLKGAFRNLAILVFGALPLVIALVWLETLIAPLDWMKGIDSQGSTGDYAVALLFWMLVLVIPVLMGGVIHQLLIGLIPNSWAPAQQRLAILLTSPVILAVFALLSTGSPGLLFSWRGLIPIGIALLCYGLTATPLSRGDSI